jgi:hypothetical protein
LKWKPEDHTQRRNDYDPAADPEHARQQPGSDAEQQQSHWIVWHTDPVSRVAAKKWVAFYLSLQRWQARLDGDGWAVSSR